MTASGQTSNGAIGITGFTFRADDYGQAEDSAVSEAAEMDLAEAFAGRVYGNRMVGAVTTIKPLPASLTIIGTYVLEERDEPAAASELEDKTEVPAKNAAKPLSDGWSLALESLLAHPDVQLRLEMVEAIADARGSRELLRKASEDPSAVVADAARQYLAERTAGSDP